MGADRSTVQLGLRHALSWVMGLTFGYAGFAVVRAALSSLVMYDWTIYGPSLMLFAFCIFINIHYYFMNSVMWRKRNLSVQLHLFSQ